MTHDEMIKVIQAHKDGKRIQCKLRRRESEWGDSLNPSWDFPNHDYRIKPDPLVVWVNEYEDGALSPYQTKDEALGAARRYAISCKRAAVKMVEAED